MSKRASSAKGGRSSKSAAAAAVGRMVVNYVPGEECRVAILEGDKLEELHVERFASASRVGNIYVGRVINVEPAIQAAFVDFGVGENGFLHVSDLHPRYFPGETEETTESVGHKTPRRERPPIQQALRRGDEVIVQVLKEGIGTKGPTLTSYLSIPGRFLVMMPGMDRVGVSRKVEDEDLRRKMRDILDQLELPEGFGFIVRTAGMDRTKLELKRDLAYLVRLWKDMERRQKAGDKPRLLYSESDLLVRSLRDLLTTDVAEVVIDSEFAIKRAARFMKIVSPRGGAKLLHFPGRAPIFHAFGIEQQIATMNAREVPLASGGRLVIDQTEAIVAIDVNSGKSREARDAEENAFQTNMEAVDEICRQLRLRDMGGIIINDLIDMRSMAHRREVEKRFAERLKRDRARSTVANISPFGILEMTRQRMRGSHESVHFADCPTCRGRGVVQRPDSVASEALRELAAILEIEKIHKVELVVPARVAGELLSTKRKLLSRVERNSGKHVDVRVSEALAVDRFSMYAYDAQGADIDVANLPKPRTPTNLVELDLGTGDETDWADESAEAFEEPAEAESAEELAEFEADADPIAVDAESDEEGDGELDPTLGLQGKRRGRRGRGRSGERGADRPDERRGGRSEPHRGEASRGDSGGRGGARGDARGAGRHRDESRGQGQRGRDDHRQGLGRGPRPTDAPEGAEHDNGRLPPIAEAPGVIVSDRKGFGAMPILLGDHGDDSAPPEVHAAEGEDRDASMHGGPEGDDRRQDDGTDDGNGGTDVQAGEGQPGEGGRRRRRRRRRRGRGGAAMNSDGQPRGPQRGEPGEGGPQDEGGGDSQNAGDANEAQEDEGGDAEGFDDGVEPGEGQRREDADGPVMEGQPGEGQPGEGGRRRRRRRRRGRGRGGQGGENGRGAESGGGDSFSDGTPAPQTARPPQGGRAPRESGTPQGSRPGPSSRGEAPAPRGEPAPAKPESPATPSAPRPRTLYGAVRRKLSPSELNKRPKPE